jgi:hypothetical protein
MGTTTQSAEAVDFTRATPDNNDPSTPNFKDYLWQNKNNRRILILVFILILIQFGVFKYFYPSAGFINDDSYVYLETASQNLGFNSYMVGYGMFLRLFSVFTKSDLALVIFQYLFIQGSALLLLFTIFYFFNPYKWIKYFLLVFVVLNPLYLYMSNYVSSDPYFMALSLLWFTLLLWIINKPSNKLMYYHSLILFICFTVRYNALIYPFIFAIALYLSNTKIKTKMFGFGLIIFFIGSFIIYTGNKFKELTGQWQYAPFSGWQLANNAMYAYRYVDSADRKPVAKKLAPLDNMVRKYFDTAHNPFKNPEILQKASTVYMWHPRLTLYKYRNMIFAHDTTASEFKKWSSMGPLYSEFGLSIIAKYPFHFLKYFVWPNACKYYAPPVEFLEKYNSGENMVKPPAIQWFGYKSPKVIVHTKNLKVHMLDYYPILTGTINAIFLLSLLCLLSLGFFSSKTNIRSSILLIVIFWLANAFFTIFASSVALRFQAFPIILITVFAFIAIDLMLKTAIKQEAERKNLSLSKKAEGFKENLSILPVDS